MKNKQYKVGIYLRLSKEDENKGESNSIASQREILKNYIKDNELEFVCEYVDDGISGTTFNRNGFNQMIRDVIEKKINMIIIKDLSRLGRDHIEFGTYVERFFPEHQVRLVAIGDLYDSENIEKNNSTMILFKSMYNEMYVKDISDKIKLSVSNKRKMGKFLGAVAPYGYNKDKGDCHKLVIDEYSSKIVKRIFMMFIEGNSISKICRVLTNEGVLIPSVYKNLNRGLKSLCYGEWTTRTVSDILTNPTYIGNLTQGRLRKVNYKSKKIFHVKKDDWIITYNTCPKIVDENIFNQVQKIYNANKNRTVKNHDILLKGIVYCSECEHTIGFRVYKSKTKSRGEVVRIYGNCNYYLKHRYSNVCSSHSVNYYELEDLVLREVRMILRRVDKVRLVEIISRYDKSLNKLDIIENELRDLASSIKVNLSKLDRMYLDMLDGKIDNGMYERLTKRILEENDLDKRKINELEERKRMILDVDKYINYEDIVMRYLVINRNLINNLISKIVIDKDNNIEIYYKFNNLFAL